MVQASRVRAPFFGLALLIAAAFSAPNRAPAAEPFEIQLSAPDACGDAKTLGAAIRELAGGNFDPRGIRLDIVREEQSWSGELTLPGGQRALSGESCAAVLEAAAVVVALSLEHQAGSSALGGPEEAPSAPAGALAANAETPAPAVELGGRELTGSRERALRLMLQAGLMGEVGLLPSPSFGPRMRVTFEIGAYSVDAGAALLLARRAQLRTGESAEIHWFAAQLAACRKVRGRLRACFGGEAGRIVGTGSGVDVALTAHGNWLAVTADASFGGALAAPFSWEVGLGVAGAVVLPEFGFDNLGTLHRPSSASGRLFAGVGWQ